jgi:GGDEF domain-containing protein
MNNFRENNNIENVDSESSLEVRFKHISNKRTQIERQQILNSENIIFEKAKQAEEIIKTATFRDYFDGRKFVDNDGNINKTIAQKFGRLPDQVKLEFLQWFKENKSFYGIELNTATGEKQFKFIYPRSIEAVESHIDTLYKTTAFDDREFLQGENIMQVSGLMMKGRSIVIESAKKNNFVEGLKHLGAGYLDMNFFKLPNDVIGHKRCDELMRQMFRALNDLENNQNLNSQGIKMYFATQGTGDEGHFFIQSKDQINDRIVGIIKKEIQDQLSNIDIGFDMIELVRQYFDPSVYGEIKDRIDSGITKLLESESLQDKILAGSILSLMESENEELTKSINDSLGKYIPSVAFGAVNLYDMLQSSSVDFLDCKTATDILKKIGVPMRQMASGKASDDKESSKKIVTESNGFMRFLSMIPR